MKNRNAIILEIISFLFVFLFMYAATSKLFEYDLFKAQIGKSPLIMYFVDWIAWLVPAIEIVIALMLIFPKTRLFALYCSLSLMFAFTAYIYIITTFSPYVPCSCGGILSGLDWDEHLVFNIAFTLLALAGILLHLKQHVTPSLTGIY